MNIRIAQIIVALGIKRTEFAKKIGISSPFVSELCSGAKKASDRTITDICREFNVSETWLRPGGYFQNGNNHSRPARWYGHPCPHRLRDRGPRRSGGVLPGNP